MLGFLGFRLPRVAILVIAGGFLLIAVVLAAFYLSSPHAALRITTGPAGGVAERFISALVTTTEATHPRIHFETVPVSDLKASSKALEDGNVNIAIVRTDVSPPNNGQTLVILRRDVLAVVIPHGSKIESITQLEGKTVTIPQGPVQEENSRALDLLLGYFNVPPRMVKRVFLPLPEIGAAIRDKHAAAVFAVGPIGPGQAVDAVAAVAKATRETPSILAMDEGDAISNRYPGLQSIDVPKGSFKARPAVPNDDIKAVAVSYRLVVPVRMLNMVAGALARSIIKTKTKLTALTPLASMIEAPDPDEKNPILPVHPGVAAYLTSGDQSFFDEIQTYLYAVGIPLSLIGSAIAVIAGLLANRRLAADQQQIFRLLVIAEEASKADAGGLEALDGEFKSIVTKCVGDLAQGNTGTDQAAVTLAIEHARRSIEGRKVVLDAAHIPHARGPVIGQ